MMTVAGLVSVLRDERGQATAAALAVLTIGMIIIAPLLNQASTTLIGARSYRAEIMSQYSSDAGIEWGLWRMQNNPTLTTSTSYTSTPLQPFPPSINGSAFPTTQIRFIGIIPQTITTNPPWVPGSGWHSFSVVVPTTMSATITVTVNAATNRVQFRFQGRTTTDTTPPFSHTYTVTSGGTYIIQVRTPGYSGSATIQFDVTYGSLYTYDIRSQATEVTITSRATVTPAGVVSVVNWQVQ